MSDVAEFPLPGDVTEEERTTARTEIGRHAKIVGEEPRVIRFEGRLIGQTGPIWHMQYTRLYHVANGYLAAGHDLREGIKVVHAREAERLAQGFEHPGVREFLEDELRFRNIIGSSHEPAHT